MERGESAAVAGTDVPRRCRAEPGARCGLQLRFTFPVAINKQNKPQTEVEKAGLQYIVDNPGQNYYGEETLGGARYYTAVYPDVAVAKACVTCHNDHKDSPKTDFELGDVMGGVVIRIPL